MLFNSNEFYLFLPIVFAIYWIIPQRFRWGVLLISSYYFYMSWNVKYVVLILLTTVVSYVTALLLAYTDSQRLKKVYLVLALLISLGVLFFFKYFDFLAESINHALIHVAIPMQVPTLRLMLPVGISFYTFQTLSYVIDVYKGQVQPTKHFGKYATFISFFPQLVAGPIERTRNLLPQIENEHTFHYEKGIEGVKLIAWGFFMKIAIADTISGYVDLVYEDVTSYTGFALVIATILFTFQIYCDFAGYSNIAIGVAKLFDIDLMTNFKAPYAAGSIGDFWSRWHISLSTWFRDYVYIPLGGNRKGAVRQRLNLLITFLVSGLWHGANWTFLLWGGVHGLGQIIENLFVKTKERRQKRTWYGVLYTFVFVSFAWIFFRSNTISDTGYVLSHLFTGLSQPVSYFMNGILAFKGVSMKTGSNMISLLISLVCICVLMAFDFVSVKKDPWGVMGKMPKVLRYFLYFLLILAVLYSRKLGDYQFVYFQF